MDGLSVKVNHSRLSGGQEHAQLFDTVVDIESATSLD